MSCSEIVDFTFTWKIENYAELINKDLESPTFIANNFLGETKWKLSSKKCDDFISIFLTRHKTECTSTIIARIEFTITILAADISSNISKKVTVRCFNGTTNDGFGFDKFVSLKKIFDEKHLYLPEDNLTIQCYMTQKEPIFEYKVVEVDNTSLQKCILTKTLSTELYDLYLNNKFCDIQMKTNDRVFSVHKSVICARSPVFCAMFESDTQEKISGVVDINDIDSNTLSSMLTFMYCDSVEDMNHDQATKLYAAADKYCILPLKQECSTSLKSSLSCSNIGDIYVLADMYQDVNLKSAVQNYVFIYAKKVFKSSDWEHFMEFQPKLSAQLMHYLWLKQLDD